VGGGGGGGGGVKKKNPIVVWLGLTRGTIGDEAKERKDSGMPFSGSPKQQKTGQNENAK